MKNQHPTENVREIHPPQQFDSTDFSSYSWSYFQIDDLSGVFNAVFLRGFKKEATKKSTQQGAERKQENKKQNLFMSPTNHNQHALIGNRGFL